MNSITKHQTKTLKDALYDTIHHNGSLTIEAIAEQLDMTKSYLYRSATPDADTDGERATGVRFPLKQLVPLIRTTGDFQVLDLIEFTLGRVALPLPKIGSLTTKDVHANALNAVVQFGDLIKEIQISIADGQISEKEQDRIDKEGREAIQAIMLLLRTRDNL
ncbi:MAG: phage regulatory CII family protein [Desulforhopalus sp.]